MPALQLAGLLYLGSGIRLAVLIAVRATVGRRAGITWPHGNALWWLLSAIAAGCAVSPNLLMLGLHLTDAASASLILDIEGIFTVLLAWIVFKKTAARAEWDLTTGSVGSYPACF